MAVTQTVPARLLAALPAARQDEDTGGWRLPGAPPSAAGGAAGRVRGARGGGRSGWGFAPPPQVRARLLLLRRWVGNGARPPPTAAAMAPGPAVPNHPPDPWRPVKPPAPAVPRPGPRRPRPHTPPRRWAAGGAAPRQRGGSSLSPPLPPAPRPPPEEAARPARGAAAPHATREHPAGPAATWYGRVGVCVQHLR